MLYTRSGCHLCDDAERILLEFGLNPKEVDVDADPALAERYGHRVPVVEINGRERFFGRIDPVLLRRIVESEAVRDDF